MNLPEKAAEMLTKYHYLCLYCENSPLNSRRDSISQFSVIREKNIILMFTAENTPCFANNFNRCRNKNILYWILLTSQRKKTILRRRSKEALLLHKTLPKIFREPPMKYLIFAFKLKSCMRFHLLQSRAFSTCRFASCFSLKCQKKPLFFCNRLPVFKLPGKTTVCDSSAFFPQITATHAIAISGKNRHTSSWKCVGLKNGFFPQKLMQKPQTSWIIYSLLPIDFF